MSSPFLDCELLQATSTLRTSHSCTHQLARDIDVSPYCQYRYQTLQGGYDLPEVPQRSVGLSLPRGNRTMKKKMMMKMKMKKEGKKSSNC